MSNQLLLCRELVQYIGQIERGELAGASPDAEGVAIFDLAKHPPSIPFLIVPMGAAVQHYKEEQYYLHTPIVF